MDINDLRSFSQVARSGSFSQAAFQLNRAQPTLSRQIQKLEGELGVQLLVRRPRGIELTQAGSVLLSQADELIERLIPTRVKADSFQGFQNGASSESCPSASATGPMHDAQCGLV